MPTIYEKNLAIIKKRGARLYDAILAYEDCWNQEIALSELAKNGDTVVAYYKDGKANYLNSRYNPSAEAEKFMADCLDMSEQCYITLYGLGNGAFSREFLNKNKKNTGCFVYEPCADIFMRVIHDIDITDLLASNRFFLAVAGLNDDQFGLFLQKYSNTFNEGKNKYLLVPVYKKIFPEQLKTYHSIITDKVIEYRIQTNTILDLGKRFAYTSIQNMRFLPGCRAGISYVGAFPEGLPVIIVAAGPSLEKNVDLLKEAKGRAFILVVDSAIRTVMKRGIRPDAIITVDNNKELRNFEAEGLSDIVMLADMSASTDALELVKPKDLIFYTSDFLVWDRLFKEQGSEIRSLFSGGSVALAAMALAVEWGFKRIIMIGQDLALTSGKQYADGSKLVGNEFSKKNLVMVKDIYGEDVVTKMDYFMFIKNIEDLAYSCPDVEFIDATEGGAFKKNTTIMPLRDAIDKYCTVECDVEGILRSKQRLFQEQSVIIDTLKGMREHLSDIGAEMTEISVDCTRAADMLIAKRIDTQALKAINARMAGLDKKLTNMEEQILFTKVAAQTDYDFNSTVYEEMEDDLQESIRLYQNSSKYYRGLADTVPEINAMIDECMAKLKPEV